MEAPFRSRLITAYDYRLADLSDFCVPFAPDEEALAESLLSVRKKYAELAPVSVIANGDFATISCASEKAKFQKEAVDVCVGKHLYSKGLEEQLPGLSVGETAMVETEGVQVRVTVRKILRSVLPELTDAFVAKTFSTVHTVEELKGFYIDEQRENHLRQQAAWAAAALSDQVIAKSEFALDEAERLAMRKDGEDMIREHCALNGIDLAAVTDAQAIELFGFQSAAAYIEWFADICEKDIPAALLGYELLAKEGKTFTGEQYEAELMKNAEEAGMPAAELRRKFTYAAYVRQSCAEYFSNLLENYAYRYIKERIG